MNIYIYEEILKIILKYAIVKKTIDRSFFETIMAIISSSQDLGPLALDIKNEYARGDAGYKNKKVTIFFLTLMESAYNNAKLLGLNSSACDKYIYEHAAGDLLHELIHAKQEKEQEIEKGTFKSRLLSLSEIYKVNINDVRFMSPDELRRYQEYKKYLYQKYLEYHNYAPNEREAYIEQYTFRSFISAELNRRTGDLALLNRCDISNLGRLFLSDYKKGLIPADYYFYNLGISDKWEAIKPQSDTLSSREKAIYGLDMPLEEVEKEYDTFVRQRLRI